MIPRLVLLAAIGTSVLIGPAAATNGRAVDPYLAMTSSAPAGDELCPTDVRVVALGSASAAVYYTYDADGADTVRVVTTIATNTDGMPARFVSYLTAGEKAAVSVAGPIGTAPASLELAYDGDRLRVRTVTEAQPQS